MRNLSCRSLHGQLPRGQAIGSLVSAACTRQVAMLPTVLNFFVDFPMAHADDRVHRFYITRSVCWQLSEAYPECCFPQPQPRLAAQCCKLLYGVHASGQPALAPRSGGLKHCRGQFSAHYQVAGTSMMPKSAAGGTAGAALPSQMQNCHTAPSDISDRLPMRHGYI